MSVPGLHGAHIHRVLDPRGSEQIGAGLCALAIMTKAPRAGSVKTRLQPPLSATEAAQLNVCFLRDTATNISRSGGATCGVAVYTPLGHEADYHAILPPDFVLLPQRGSDFGERLTNAMVDLFDIGFEACCLIDSDSPTVAPEVFIQAAACLGEPGERIVIGPADDGGYYLIGMKKPYPRLFQNIDWSTERVFQQTLARAAELKVDVHRLPVGFDVDDEHSLRRLCSELVGGSRQTAPATRAFLEQLIAAEGRERIWPQ